MTMQDRIDSVVHHALINQSGVLVNTLTSMTKKVVDGTLAEEKARGPVYFPNNLFPPYRTIKTDGPSTSTIDPNQDMHWIAYHGWLW